MFSHSSKQGRQFKAVRLKQAEVTLAVLLTVVGAILSAFSAQAEVTEGIAAVTLLLFSHLVLDCFSKHRLDRSRNYLFNLLLAAACSFGIWHFYLSDQYRAQQASKTEGDLVAEDVEPGLASAPPVIQIGHGETASKIVLGAGPRTSSLFFQYIDDVKLVVENGPSGVVLSTPVLDQAGHKMGEIIKNHWKVFPPWSSDKNYEKHSLEILDAAGNVVLQVKLRKNVAELQGVWRDESGKGLEIYDIPGQGGRVAFATALDTSLIRYKIPKMFVYSSSNHWGELAQ